MDRNGLEKYIAEVYSTDAEFPWASYPDYMVFRHYGNRKWFAVIMTVPKEKLGLSEEGKLDIVNLKCEPAVIGSLVLERGIFPAYHMSKTNWISVALDGSVSDNKIEMLLDVSFNLTNKVRLTPNRR